MFSHGNMKGVANAVIFLRRGSQASNAQKVEESLGSLGQFVGDDLTQHFYRSIEFQEIGQDPSAHTSDSPEPTTKPASAPPCGGQDQQGGTAARPAVEASRPVSEPTAEVQNVEVQQVEIIGDTVMDEGSQVLLSSPPLTGRRRRPERLGDNLQRIRSDCARHDQLRALLPLLPGEPQLTKSARKKLAEKTEIVLAEQAAVEAEEVRRKAVQRSGQAREKLKHAGLTVISKVRMGEEDHTIQTIMSQPLAEPQPQQQTQEPSMETIKSEDLEDVHRPDPWYHHLKQSLREPATPRYSARRDQLTSQSNFGQGFIADLAVRPRADVQPLLFSMEQGDYVAAEQEATAAEQVLLCRRLEALRYNEPRSGPWAVPPPPNKTQAEDAGKAPRRFLLGRAGAKKKAGAQRRQQDIHVMLELLDPGNSVGSVNPDAIVPLMFWLGLTKSRAAALDVLKLGFGAREIEVGAMAIMSEHVEVQLRLIEGLRNMVRRDSLDHLCEYMTGNICQRIRTWFNSMRSDPFGLVDITQVQSLFSRMEVTTDRQTLFRFLSHMAENPNPSAASDPREKIAVEKKKFSLNGFISMLCRSTAAWCLHRTMLMLNAQSSHGQPSLHDIANRWIQLQRKITISLLVNQRFWGRESRNVLAALQPPQMTCQGLEELKELTPEQWNVLFQRVSAQGLASVLPDDVDEGSASHGGQKVAPEGAKKALTPRGQAHHDR